MLWIAVCLSGCAAMQPASGGFDNPLNLYVNHVRAKIESAHPLGKNCLQPPWYDKNYHYRHAGQVVHRSSSPNVSEVRTRFKGFQSIGSGKEKQIKDMIPMHRAKMLHCYAVHVKKQALPVIEPILLASPDLRYAIFYRRRMYGTRWPELEQALIERQLAENAVLYAKYIMKGPWPEGEPLIAADVSRAVSYAEQILKGRFILAEPTIQKDPEYATYYAERIRGRWREAEPVIAQNAEYAFEYLTSFYQNKPWPEAEPVLAQNPEHALYYAKMHLKGRFEHGEAAIMTDAERAYLYAKEILKAPWPEAEAAIKTDGQSALKYVRDVRGKPWPIGQEGMIREDPYVAGAYARRVLKKRWSEMEPLILKDLIGAAYYAEDFFPNGWPELEKSILNSDPTNDRNKRAASHYANKVIKGRWKEAEALMKPRYEWNGQKYD